MKAHAAAGNRAEALRVYARCRKLFRDELGAEPSEKTANVFLSILRT
jgi:DNA-binding SARP family transcriptional activator